MKRVFVIGLAGGSGSGKTTILQRLQQGPWAESLVTLPHDAYYRNRSDMPAEVRETLNWDHPDALDNALYLSHVDALCNGQSIEMPVYDFREHVRTSQTIRIEPRPILLLDGILLLAIAPIRQRLDLRVYVDTPADLRILRRLARDVQERGRTVQGVTEQYIRTVRPMHEQFVEPGRSLAHLVIPWELHNEPAVEVLQARIAAWLVSYPPHK
ncbi:MAG: uridine kinase [Gemmataceae bacterium]